MDAGTGWIQDATLTIAGASLTGTIPGLPCDLDDGDLVVGNHPPTMIPKRHRELMNSRETVRRVRAEQLADQENFMRRPTT